MHAFSPNSQTTIVISGISRAKSAKTAKMVRLHVIDLKSPTVFNHLKSPSSKTLQKLGGSTLPRLQHVAFLKSYLYNVNSIVNFLANTSSPLKSISLEQVSLRTPGDVIDPITKYHFTGLRSLKVNHRLTSDGNGIGGYCRQTYNYPSNTFLDSTHLFHLLFTCLNIETLDIDLESKEEWDYNLLDMIVSFPKLTKLVLRLEREEADTWNEWSDEYLPYEDEETFYHRGAAGALTQGLGVYLRMKKVGRELKNLKTWVGDTQVENRVLSRSRYEL